MYRIDRQKNEIFPLQARSFTELGFRERSHLQEWVAKKPEVFGEELLIIQKEFAGFSDTNERLDLLALDKQGSLVVIENKLDDAGRDVTWQALKYASYCASLSRENIRAIYQDYLSKTNDTRSADERLCEFFEVEELDELSLNKGVTQRVILVAGRFRKEVTSTVLWLMSFKVRLQCFKVTPFSFGEETFLNVEQIIPTKDAEEFMIRLADKAQDEIAGAEAEKARYAIRREFWANLLAKMNQRSDLFQNVGPSPENWISAASGIRGVGFNFAVTRGGCRVELYIGRREKSDNERIFEELLSQRTPIEQEFGGPLTWERLDNRQACKVKFECDGNVFDRECWPVLSETLAGAMERLEAALRSPLDKLR